MAKQLGVFKPILHNITFTQAKNKVFAQCDCGSNLGKHDGWSDANLAALAHQLDVRAGRR